MTGTSYNRFIIGVNTLSIPRISAQIHLMRLYLVWPTELVPNSAQTVQYQTFVSSYDYCPRILEYPDGIFCVTLHLSLSLSLYELCDIHFSCNVFYPYAPYYVKLHKYIIQTY
jgi:hypothetical protein